MATLAATIRRLKRCHFKAELSAMHGDCLAGCREERNQLDLDIGSARDRRDIVRKRSSECEQLVRLGAGADANTLDLPGEKPALEGELGGCNRPLDAGLDFYRLELHRSDRSGEGQILGGIVPRLESEESDEVAEPLDEGGLGVHAAGPPAKGSRKLHWTNQLCNS